MIFDYLNEKLYKKALPLVKEEFEKTCSIDLNELSEEEKREFDFMIKEQIKMEIIKKDIKWFFFVSVFMAFLIVFLISFFIPAEFLFEKGFYESGRFYYFNSDVISTLKNYNASILDRAYVSLQSGMIGAIWLVKGSPFLGWTWIVLFCATFLVSKIKIKVLLVLRDVILGMLFSAGTYFVFYMIFKLFL